MIALLVAAIHSCLAVEYPCILVRQNANLRALWLPKLKEIIYGNVTGKFVMYLEGDKLELTMQDIATLRFLTGDHLRVVNPVNSDYGRTKPYYSGDPPAEYLYADEVLPFVVGALICWVLITLVVSIIFLVKRINLNSMESAVMEEMVKIRAISIQAKLSRYEIEDYQRKNPTKTFTEAANAVAKNSSEQSQKPATSNVRKSRAILLDAVSAGKKAN
ncbi:hypothetical protein Q1695_003256 [Nippostrongylus brasiliensis]|nr:hypothetical protein Q1695_003256 [Nippostrongylus brasiliensis]